VFAGQIGGTVLQAHAMSGAAAPCWRTAGMTYLSYANTCAAVVRTCLKVPFKAKLQPYSDGAPQ
jgi:F-type H+-transporting ATPase subunit epsilon